MSQLTADAVRSLIYDTLLSPEFRRGVFSGTARGEATAWVRVTVRPVELRGDRQLQFSYFDGRKTLYLERQRLIFSLAE